VSSYVIVQNQGLQHFVLVSNLDNPYFPCPSAQVPIEIVFKSCEATCVDKTWASSDVSWIQIWSLNVFNQGCAQKPTRGYKRENWDITGQHEQIRPQQAMNCIGIDWSNPEFFVKSNEIPQFHTTHFHTCPSIHVHTFPWNVQLLCGQIVSYQNR